MSKNTIIAATIGAVVALTALYTMNSQAFGLWAPQAVTETPDAPANAAITSRVSALPPPAAAATVPVVVNTVVEEGRTVAVKIGTHLSSRDAKVGDPVSATTTEAVVVNGRTVIPSGSLVSGIVSQVETAHSTKSAAVLQVHFSRIGAYSVSLSLISPDLSERARRANQAADAGLVGGGGVVGGVIGSQTIKKNGAVIGAAAGAVVGAVAAANLGANVQLKLGEPGKIRFEMDLPID